MLTKLENAWHWGEDEERAFEELKKRLTDAPILWRTIKGCPFELHTDCSALGLDVILT